jgi:hypothetical protein
MNAPVLTRSAKDYPYDPKADIRMLVGLERLTAIRDRSLAEVLYGLYWHAESNDRRVEASVERERAKRDQEDFDDLQSMAEKALGGSYGPEAKRTAQGYLERHARNAGNLEELRRLLRKVPGRASG